MDHGRWGENLHRGGASTSLAPRPQIFRGTLPWDPLVPQYLSPACSTPIFGRGPLGASITSYWLDVRTISPMVGQASSDGDVKPPTGLKAPGRRLWLSVVGKYV